MNDKVTALMNSVREDLNAAEASDERVSVDRKELDALVTYWEVRAAEDERAVEGLVVGDRIESREGVTTLYGDIPKGTTGTLYEIREDQNRHYPFCVETDDGKQVAYQRHEIRKAR